MVSPHFCEKEVRTFQQAQRIRGPTACRAILAGGSEDPWPDWVQSHPGWGLRGSVARLGTEPPWLGDRGQGAHTQSLTRSGALLP